VQAPSGTVQVLAFDELDSTNAEARRRAEAGETGPVWITAARQTAGRGRRGREWRTGAGDLAATLLTLTHRAPADAARISFVAALAVADLAAAYVPEPLVRLKWPNDVLVDARKLSGILIESGQSPRGGLWLAVGIGVNLAEAPPGTEHPATVLAEHLRPEFDAPPPPTEALRVLSQALARWLEVWDSYGFEPIRHAWTARASGLGEPCVVRLPGETLDGVAEGLDEDGALVLRLGGGAVRRIAAGDVFFPAR
jgi:BirA family biotin operon repressor/biotin-[acetyl-CoA-carboxylase] ligase